MERKTGLGHASLADPVTTAVQATSSTASARIAKQMFENERRKSRDVLRLDRVAFDCQLIQHSVDV